MAPSMRSFTIILIGQAISLLGSSLTGFALGIWAYQQAGSVTDFGMIALAASLPMALLSPIAGTMVDRWNRKAILLVGQTAAVIMTALMAWLFWQDQLELWHIVALTAIGSVFNAFVMPTISATVPLMVPTSELNRANAMIALAMGLVQLGSPALAGALIESVGLKWIFVIDLITFTTGVTVLIFSHIPQPEASHKTLIDTLTEEVDEADEHSPAVCEIERELGKDPIHDGNLAKALMYSVRYLWSRPSLLGLIFFAAMIAFNIQAIAILILPVLLAFTDAQTLGIVGSIAGFGTLLGSAFILAWGGPKRQMYGVISAGFLISLGYIFGPIKADVFLVSASCFFIMCCFPVVTTCAQTLFQRKVPVMQQGRVFGLRNFIIGMMQPAAIVVSAPLADMLFEPAMQPGGAWANWLGPIYGTGDGRGAAVLISCIGLLTLFWTLLAAALAPIRRLDLLLPDQISHKDDVSTDQNTPVTAPQKDSKNDS